MTRSIETDPQMDVDTQQLAQWCKALGHPARMQIVAHLKQTSSCVCGEIVELLPQAQSTVSQHLKVLKEAGIICGEVEGPRTCYCLDPEAVKRFKRMVSQFLSI